jgi:ABC-2 type transport system ATP-binding protein
MEPAAIEARGLAKVFPNGVVAVNDFDLAVRHGSVYGLIGRNGSGKTTALRLLLGLLRADHGDARVLGWDLWQAPRGVRQQVVYVSQTERLPGAMTLEALGRCLTRVNSRWSGVRARSLAKQWDLPWSRAIYSLSDGEQRRAALLLAFAAGPRVLVLDEPAAGFDPVARRELLEQVLEAATQNDGCTVLLSTHVIGDLERMADHIGIMDHGRLALSSPLEDLLNQIKRVQVIFDGEEAPAQFAVPGALRTCRTGAVCNAIVRWTGHGELEALRGAVNARVQIFPIGLEDIFIELFGKGGHSGEAPHSDQQYHATPHAISQPGG